MILEPGADAAAPRGPAGSSKPGNGQKWGIRSSAANSARISVRRRSNASASRGQAMPAIRFQNGSRSVGVVEQPGVAEVRTSRPSSPWDTASCHASQRTPRPCRAAVASRPVLPASARRRPCANDSREKPIPTDRRIVRHRPVARPDRSTFGGSRPMRRLARIPARAARDRALLLAACSSSDRRHSAASAQAPRPRRQRRPAAGPRRLRSGPGRRDGATTVDDQGLQVLAAAGQRQGRRRRRLDERRQRAAQRDDGRRRVRHRSRSTAARPARSCSTRPARTPTTAQIHPTQMKDFTTVVVQ